MFTCSQSGQGLASSLSLSAFLRILVSHLYSVGKPSLLANFMAALHVQYKRTIDLKGYEVEINVIVE